MSVESDAPSWRQLRVSLRALGARPIRTRGSHETWRFQDGETFIVIINHVADSVPLGILVKFRRLRARRCACIEDEAALLGRTGS